MGQFQPDAGMPGCEACPVNTNSLESGLQRRYDCLDCIPPESCLGGGKCASGYRGPMCAFCAKRFFKLKDKCVQCPEQGAVIGIIAGVIFIMFAFTVLSMAGGSGQHGGMKSMKIRMAVPFTIVVCRLQLSLEFFNIGIQWVRVHPALCSLSCALPIGANTMVCAWLARATPRCADNAASRSHGLVEVV